MNIFGYAEWYLKYEDLMKRYQADLIIKYLQLQINELSEKVNKQEVFLKDTKTHITNTFNLQKDLIEFKT